jgi:hypothetical protein
VKSVLIDVIVVTNSTSGLISRDCVMDSTKMSHARSIASERIMIVCFGTIVVTNSVR